MICRLTGILLEATPLSLVLDVQGVGYAVNVPLPTSSAHPAIGSKVSLYIHPIYREDAATLYGFHEVPLRDFFQLLVEKVSGIGPKTGLAILSRLSLTTLQQALANGDVATLSQCPGIGKKTAERLIVELKDKVKSFASLEGLFHVKPQANTAQDELPQVAQDAISALISLGLKANDAEKNVRLAMKPLSKEDIQNLTASALIRAAL
jgi:Holliday junction DNA helicase RuvA